MYLTISKASSIILIILSSFEYSQMSQFWEGDDHRLECFSLIRILDYEHSVLVIEDHV